MDWGIIGACAGILSIIGIGVTYATKIAKMQAKIDLIWSIYVEDRLRRLAKEGDMARHSEYRITEQGIEALPPALRSALTQLAKRKKPKTIQEAHILLVKEIGLEALSTNPTHTNHTIQELALLASAYMIEASQNQR